MSAKQWIEKTHTKGIIAKAGRYGGTYAYKDIALELLQNNGVIRILIRKEILEMSRKGNCLDNSVMENFFGLLKQEIYYGVVYYSYEELKSEIERFIKYYNEKRIKKVGMDESCSIQAPSFSCIKKNETTEVAS